MLTKLMVYQSDGCNPYENLAVEQYILEHLQPGECILYLWQNQNTVVIGRNQNPWVECRVSLLEQEGGKLARRLSGGGAVFHDLGNLNFTFLTKKESYDVDKQLSVIALACQMAGISVEKSGRNDLLADGRKFSGNAFFHSQGNAYHHGTILIQSDMDKLQRYLSPSKAKLEAKGVSSVRSRVVNLTQLSPDLTIDAMKENMKLAFSQVYGMPVSSYQSPQQAKEQLAAMTKKNSSWEHLFGAPLPFTARYSQRFSWGGVEIHIQAKAGIVEAVKVYSDAMDWQLPAVIENALTGCRFKKEDMAQRLKEAVSDTAVYEDLCQMIET